MNKEIKEILDRWDKVCNGELLSTDMTLDEMIMFRDYITNLEQEKNEEFDENCKLSKWLVKKQKRIEELEQKCAYLEDIVSNTELSDEIKKADNYSKRELYKINYQRLKANQQLHQENENYFKKNNELSTLNTSLRNDRDNYKSRIDKAIEYIKEFERYIYDDILEIRENYKVVESEDLLNILTGGDK